MRNQGILKYSIVAYLGILFLLVACSKVEPPKPVFPVPEERQLAWQELEFYAFIHFNMNTFTNMEWGTGSEKPSQFDPSELDTRQWARVVKDAGMKGIILTAKHHDGFCLWPSAYTAHSVKNSPWKNGQGDVLKDLSEACREYGLKFGVYLSPWDRNHADYGKPEYVDYFRNQLKELLTNYGDVFEVWFDGANGGTGYYGGANEVRKVDKHSYYDWINTFPIIRELQPDAVIFGDAGLDVRWVGNENGKAYPTTWSNLLRDSVYAGMPEYSVKYSRGQERGTHWVPAEADVSIRPGWYYHEYEDHKVKSLPDLLDIYYESIGRNASLLLNFPVDKRGLIHENDVAQLTKLTNKIREDFKENLAKNINISAGNIRGEDYKATNMIDGSNDTYWAASDEVISTSITLDFEEPTLINRFLVQEYIALGQRISEFTLEGETEEGWEEIATETTIGYKRILRFPEVEVMTLKLSILDARACPTISKIEVYYAPPLIIAPDITRNKTGEISIQIPEENVSIYYTLDGMIPNKEAISYSEPFVIETPVTVRAISHDDQTGKDSDINTVKFDISSNLWSVSDKEMEKAIDGDKNTFWTSRDNELVVDLVETIDLSGFTYTPMQARWVSGFIETYQFYTSTDMKNWKLAKAGEFANIRNSPTQQNISFGSQKARYIKLKATKTTDGNMATFAELTVVTN